MQGEDAIVRLGFDGWIAQAPVNVLACVSEKLYHDRYREPDKLTRTARRSSGRLLPDWFFYTGAACMIILLAAFNLGLAAAFSGVFDVPRMKELLRIPPHFPVGVISIGHPFRDAGSPSLKRGRRPVGQVTHYERR